MFLIVVNSKSGKGHARSRASEFVDYVRKTVLDTKFLIKTQPMKQLLR